MDQYPPPVWDPKTAFNIQMTESKHLIHCSAFIDQYIGDHGPFPIPCGNPILKADCALVNEMSKRLQEKDISHIGLEDLGQLAILCVCPGIHTGSVPAHVPLAVFWLYELRRLFANHLTCTTPSGSFFDDPAPEPRKSSLEHVGFLEASMKKLGLENIHEKVKAGRQRNNTAALQDQLTSANRLISNQKSELEMMRGVVEQGSVTREKAVDLFDTAGEAVSMIDTLLTGQVDSENKEVKKALEGLALRLEGSRRSLATMLHPIYWSPSG